MQLSSYACSEVFSAGRLYKEPQVMGYSVFQQDRNRVHYSMAFRRLEYKTQVFINYIGDHYRTRLTHSLEVSQIARDVSRSLRLNEDLAEAISLSHDIGHPPFGHAGEDGLNIAMEKFGGFDHNAQTIKVLITLEHTFAEYHGLNLAWETIEGVAKHNGPLVAPTKGYDKILPLLGEHMDKLQGRAETFPSLEAQIASIADDIAYCNHDIDDGIRAGFFALQELEALPFVWPVFSKVMAKYPKISQSQLVGESIRRLTQVMIEDLLAESNRRITSSKVKDYSDVKQQKHSLIGFSSEMEKAKNQLKAFLMQHVYRHYKLNQINYKSKLVVQHLFEVLYANPSCLPHEWMHKITGDDTKAEVVKDYIAGMTDRYALKLYRKLCDPGFAL